eukprot:COSAG03_NODE_2657_length_2553_cov_1.659739_5_plen_56_part_00
MLTGVGTDGMETAADTGLLTIPVLTDHCIASRCVRNDAGRPKHFQQYSMVIGVQG